ncbi:Retrovirus-related Pol polyprotein from transposon 17.6 [Vitis vinifera]|uniref:Retrovirus-related Pol polyprotein from transposon 17.6 n=1 Tax=Vitis vinifera TaxID=29760 RepID=A0A438ENE4_VITVI|nr:Retrovirus-related Pol polyprotein from transposon 17.6 [Vitis vinifera]
MHEVQAVAEAPVQVKLCPNCQSYEHLVEECPAISAEREMFRDQANVVGQFKPNNNAPYGNTYNSSWRNHPNFSWKARATQYQQPDQPSQQSSSLEQAIANLSKVVGDFVGNQEAINAQINQRIDRVESTLNKRMDGMQNDISQKFDNPILNFKATNLNTEKGRFPSQPHQNPKGVHEVESQEGESSQMKDVKALITLRSEGTSEGRNAEKSTSPPFPQALHGKKGIRNAAEILEVLRQVKVNIPLLDMIKQVPTYAKFLKDLCTIKRGLTVNKKAFLTEQVSAILQCKSPLKYKDPGSPTISVMIGGKVVEKALLDLGASVNLLPYSVYKQLGLDFIVLDTDPTVKEANLVPIILGRPFLATSNAIINCRNGLMQLTFGNMTLDLNISICLKSKPLRKKKKSHQENCLMEVLKRCKKAIGWQISDLKGISPLVCTHHIYMEEEAKPIRQLQRRLNPHLQEVVRAEVLKLLQAGWRVCIDYRKLNAVTRKDHFPLPFIDQVGESLCHPFYCFLDGYSGYFQIEIDVEDQEKTTFTCPFGTYAYRRMPFGLCNAPATFQRCMLSIFSDMVERIMEVFMDDITVYGEMPFYGTSRNCPWPYHLEKGIEVDKAKVELIVKLPSPTTVKGVRQFLGHAGFYRRFIKGFSSLSKPLCELLAKDAKFIWDERCQNSFDQLKKFLTTTPIVRAPNWQLPFELMCDASDFAIGAVLGQREDGKPYVIYYASKTLNEAQRNYTTTEKELLAVVFALDKFRAYLVGSFIIVFTDHSALKYLLTKQDAKARLIR